MVEPNDTRTDPAIEPVAELATERLSAPEAARRMGIKVSSLYAYVSRGHLTRERTAEGRSTYAAAEVEELARRGRPRRSSRAPTMDIMIETSVTSVESNILRFRGHDVVELSQRCTFEQVCELLWSASLPAERPSWTGSERIDVPEGWAVDRLRAVVALAAFSDPHRGAIDPASISRSGRRIIATMVDSLAADGTATAPHDGVAARLAAALQSHRHAVGAEPSALSDPTELVDVALVLLADHELAPSTLAARVAAAARADAYGVVGAGLGPLSGSLHGIASRQARTLIDTSVELGSTVAVADVVRQLGQLPGFGHPLYPDGDPRAMRLLDALASIDDGSQRLREVDQLLAAIAQRSDVRPNIDFALAALGHVAGQRPDAGEVIFAVARTAGWLAHALEEYEQPPLRFRPRANYIGESAHRR